MPGAVWKVVPTPVHPGWGGPPRGRGESRHDMAAVLAWSVGYQMRGCRSLASGAGRPLGPMWVEDGGGLKWLS